MTSGTAIAAVLGVAAVLEDLRRRQLPDWLTAAGVAGGLACAAWGGPHGLGLATAGAIMGFLVLLPFHRYGAMGGGDNQIDGRIRNLAGSFGGLAGGAVRNSNRLPFRSR